MDSANEPARYTFRERVLDTYEEVSGDTISSQQRGFRYTTKKVYEVTSVDSELVIALLNSEDEATAVVRILESLEPGALEVLVPALIKGDIAKRIVNAYKKKTASSRTVEIALPKPI